MTLLLKNLLFTVLLPGTAAVYVPLLLAQGRSPASVWVVALALPAFAVGGAIYAWCVWDFATFGRGTPLPLDAPKRLVVRGLYRYTRNPMYVGVLTVISGWVLLFQTGTLAGYLLLVGTGFHLFVVLYEERHLHKVFGDEYNAYRNRVGRWLPKFGRRPAALVLHALVGMGAASATDGRAATPPHAYYLFVAGTVQGCEAPGPTLRFRRDGGHDRWKVIDWFLDRGPYVLMRRP